MILTEDFYHFLAVFLWIGFGTGVLTVLWFFCDVASIWLANFIKDRRLRKETKFPTRFD